MQPGSSSVAELAMLEALIPPGTKKLPKIYTAACHPVLPHVVAVAANTGTPPPHTLTGIATPIKHPYPVTAFEALVRLLLASEATWERR